MATARCVRAIHHISSFRGNAITSSLSIPVKRLRRIGTKFASTTCAVQNHIQSPNSAVITTREIDGVDIYTSENILEHPDFFEVHKFFTMKELFDAKVHLGHHEGCWNPLMKRYLFGTREHQHIIDLNETVEHLRLALNVLCHIAYRRGIILFVSTHPQFEELTQRTARECGEYFVTRRWRGGTLTNSLMLTGMTRVPDLIIFLHLPSLGRNVLAVKEAAQGHVPSIGVVDSDCNPNLIMYPIPGNDDSPSAVELYCNLFKKAVLKAKEVRRLRSLWRGKAEEADEDSENTNFDELFEDVDKHQRH
ncbi:small ribosomal subunit protein uS2m-like [Montipora foliosa]|uniref:small ribosomal subunit protein uS2m-like n=1 Tax=Montipora foliosa TaxID=591990 RepID=UPI0035F101E6